MSTRAEPSVEFDVEEPTAVRHMHETLKRYEKNAKQGLKALRDTWRKANPSSNPPAPSPEEEIAAEEVEAGVDEKKEPVKKDP